MKQIQLVNVFSFHGLRMLLTQKILHVLRNCKTDQIYINIIQRIEENHSDAQEYTINSIEGEVRQGDCLLSKMFRLVLENILGTLNDRV